MPLPDIAKLRRFALTIALVLLALVLADVKLDVPLRISPLGVPLIINRPDLLTVSLVVAAIYSTLRFVYYGMLVMPSPMRARRELLDRTEYRFLSGTDVMDDFRARVQNDVNRWFPRVGEAKVTFEISQDASGSHVKNMAVPRVVRVFCWIENIDFLLPVMANVVAVGLWAWTLSRAS